MIDQFQLRLVPASSVIERTFMPIPYLPGTGMIALACTLTGCGAVRAEQTPAQVTAELAKAVVPRPGLWATHFDLKDLGSSDLPAAALDSARREMAARGRLGQLTCVTAGTVSAARSGVMLGMPNLFCPAAYFKTDGPSYDGVWLCRSRHDDATIEAQGSSTLTRDVSTIIVNSSIPGSPRGRFTMELAVTTERIGDCPAK
jgi:hypothetical protein